MQNAPSVPGVPRDAATVMLVRAEASGISVYMTRRSSRSRFMPDAYVFPGGAVDAADSDAATLSRLYGSVDGVAPQLVVAALRELLEEAGVLLVCDDAGGPRTVEPELLSALRAELAGGGGFAALLAERNLRLDARALSYYSNWITPEGEPIRFDAHFFLAAAPANQIAAADAFEVHDGLWLAPADALARADRGEMVVRFPTRKHLERLAAFDDVEALLAHARTRAVRPIKPVLLSREERVVLEDEDSW